MGKSRKTMVNVICSIWVLVVNLVISFFLSPYIVDKIGVEANGFVTLANNFVSYAQIIVTALNAMASRFITIEYLKKDFKKANVYYNSVFWGNLIIVAVLIIPSAYFIAKMERFVEVPQDILWDVKLLFGFIFLNFFLTTGLPNWDAGTYVSNRLDRTYIPGALTAGIRCAVLFSMLAFMAPHVWYVGLSASIMTVLTLAVAFFNTHKLTPELKISLKPNKLICSFSAIKELVGSGIWNSITNIGNMLMTGVDLIVCNLLLGATVMGVVSLTKILLQLIQLLSQYIRSALLPELTIHYAKEDKTALLEDVDRDMKLTSFILTIPVVGIFVLGDKFFSLWVPSQDSHLLHILAVLSVFGFVFTAGTQIQYNLFTVYNKLRDNAFSVLLSGVVSVVVTIVLIKTTSYGIYMVAGVSTLAGVIRDLVYTIPKTAGYMELKAGVFYKMVLRTMFACIIGTGISLAVRYISSQSSWISFLISACLVAAISAIVNWFVLLDGKDRELLIHKIQGR